MRGQVWLTKPFVGSTTVLETGFFYRSLTVTKLFFYPHHSPGLWTSYVNREEAQMERPWRSSTKQEQLFVNLHQRVGFWIYADSRDLAYPLKHSTASMRAYARGIAINASPCFEFKPFLNSSLQPVLKQA